MCLIQHDPSGFGASTAPGEPAPAALPFDPAEALAPSFAQERLWFLDRIEPGSAFYNVPFARRLAGALDLSALERALGEVVRRHEALRTTFAEVDGAPVQVVAAFAAFALPVEDLSALDPVAREALVLRRAAEEAARPFDLAAGPLFRAALLRLADDAHVLLLTLHHAVSDGWSLGVLWRETAALYAAFRAGREAALDELPIQYADFALWQREQLRGAALDRELAWWRERLAGAPALLELPADHPRPAVQTFRGAHERIELSAGLAGRLQALGRAQGATLNMVLLAAFQVLLAKAAGTTDVVVGTPVAGRGRRELQGLIGLFANTLVLRTDLSGDPSFGEALRRVRETLLGAYEHQELPFEKLVAELRPERSLSHAPLFQVMFVDEGAGAADAALPGVEARPLEVETGAGKFDLSLAVAAHPGAIRCSLGYATDLFDRATAARMLGQLARVLEQAADDAERPLSALDLLDEAERARVLDDWNRTEAPYPAERCLHQLFEAQAARTPGEVAVVCGRESLTYAALDAHADRLARALRGCGVGPESRVGLCTERGLEMVAGVLGILKAGAAYVPLDPAYPAERLAYVLEDASVEVLVTLEHLRPRLPAHRARVLCMDGDLPADGGAAGAAPVHAGNLAYLIYTSGSTGRPKGVAIEHRNAVALVHWAAGVFAPEVLSGVLACTSLNFDLSVFELFLPLAVGGCVIVAENALELPRIAARDRVTLLNTVPSAAAELVRAGEVPAGVRVVCLAGEPLRRELAQAIHALPGGVELYNLYGPSEDTTYSTFARVARGDGRAPAIGRAIANTRAYVLDGALRPLPVGVPGELCLGGAGVARGYLGRPGLTAERFVPDPFAHLPGARMYRTGDLSRWRADGELHFLGRADHQVKVRGFRIEPGEVESALLRAPGVRECVVLVREDAPGTPRLVAYVGGTAAADALRAHLRQGLPEYMVPAAFVVLEQLPQTPNGKVDRKALPAPAPAADGEAYVAPRTPVEEVLAGIWAEVLGVERVGAHGGFFALGGHSLLATRVTSRVRELFGVELPLRAVFEGPTVAELAARVDALRRAGVPRLPPVVPVERTDALPLSFAQERLWFLDRLQPGSSLYNVPAVRRLEGALDRAALERALGEVVRRHEALRTVFREVDGRPVQMVVPFGGFALAAEDLAGLAGAEREAAVRARIDEEAKRPFDLAAGPPVRARLLRLADEEHVLLICMHHIVSDGWSLGVLFRDLASLYAAFRGGTEPVLPALPVQYADYASWQREQARGEALERQLAWWKERLAGAPALLELPTDRPRPAVRSHRGAYARMELPADLLERLRALGRAEGATLYMVLLAAFQVLLAKYGGSEDVVVGSSIAGRTRREVEELVGFFVNTLVLRTDLSGDPAFREVLRRVRRTALGAYEHQELPFEQLVAALQPERSLSHSPLFQAMFSVQDAEGGEAGLPGLRTERVAADPDTAKFDLNLVFTPHAHGLRATVAYSTELFERATIQRMLGHLARVLEQAASGADPRLSRISLLAEAERAQVVEGWNATDAAYPAGACTHTLFEAQAARTPDAVALTCEDRALTYAELDARANQLAHWLRGRGVGPDARVAICMERGVEVGVGLLAVLKAGGCYVPLDPAYPADRLRSMLQDSRPLALLAHGATAGLFAAAGVPVVDLDSDAAAWAELPRTAPAPAGLTPDHLAYVIYTSGSTGRPKGVMNQHRAVVNRLAWGQAAWRIGAGEAVLCKTSLSFDGSLRELFLPWSAGARVVMARPGGQRDPDYLLETLRREGVRTVNLVPSMLQLLLEHPEVEKLAGLGQLLCGGEALPAGLLRRFHARLPHVAVHNLYGPSEAATALMAMECAPETGRATVPVGRPNANTRAYLLDPAGSPVPVGVPGELYVAGLPVGRGYLDRPALTAERFVPDPFSPGPGARMYRTGDLGRWLADGRIEFLGRNDFQVKVRGFRIEPGEVEARLAEHPAVRETAVVAREDVPGDTRLVAYCVGGEVAADVLRAHLAERLPEYMVPSAFVRLDALPLTPSGKLDRRALPAPGADAGAGPGYEAPAGEVEAGLAEIWADVLGVERVGRRDHFFALGGHSLLVTRVISRVRTAFGAALAVRALFEAPVLEELARCVEAARGGEGGADLRIPRAGREGSLPLSFPQQRLWLLDRLHPGLPLYNVSAAWRLRGALDAATLAEALTALVLRHEPLRTVFGEAEGEPVQRVVAAAAVPLPVMDLRALAGAEREPAVRGRMERWTEAPFDLRQGPLFRAELLRVGDHEHVLLLAMHHIVSDGWSMGILFRELSALYAARLAGADAGLAALPVQYADYAAWQRETLTGAWLEREVAWWRGRLSGAPALLALPTDRPRPAVQSYRGALHRFTLPAALAGALEALARREGASLYMVLLAAFQLLLARYGGQDEVVVGSPIDNRSRPELEGLIGFFVNTIALRTGLGGNPSFREVVARVRETTLDAYAHQEVPFEKLVEELQPERSLGHNPIFQAFFALHNLSAGALRLPGVEVDSLPIEGATAKFDLALFFVPGEDGELRGAFQYASDLFDAATPARMADHLRVLLEAAAADPGRPVRTLPVTTAAERDTIVREWSGAGERFPVAGSLHQRFEACAAARPNAVAAVCDGRSLTYGALNARANRVARGLRARGVGPESRVGLCAGRSLDLVVGVLAVLKAGGAYVPLDPAYPADRLAYMAEDSGIRVLLAPSALRGRVPAEGIELVGLDDVPLDELAEDLGAPVDPSNLAYVIYTSGSTGRPKGVGVTHGNVLRLFDSTQASFGFGEQDAWTLFHSYAFDFSVWELWGALLFGGRLVVVPWGVSRDPVAFRALLERERVTVLSQTPSAFRALARVDAEAAEPLEHLRTVVFGGEALAYESLRGWLDRYGPRRPRLVNMYGITETTVHVTWHTVTGAELRRAHAGSGVGVPIPDLRAYVLDPAGNPAPVGVAGELHVGGAGLARGYLGRAALTAQRFVPDPFAGEAGARLYRSGDLARWKADGTLEYLGRIDQQVKVRGHRVELGEIQSLLLAQPGVAEAAVVVRGAGDEAALVGYFVPAGEAPPQAALRDALRLHLPEYMVPAAYVALEKIPLTANGKLDRAALPAPGAAGGEPGTWEAPRTPVEEVLAAIWCEVLKVERVGARDDFFDLGGHSLRATQAVARVREAFGVSIPLRALFEEPTVAQLAGRVEALRQGGEPTPPAVAAVDRDGPLPLSFGQERLWFLQRMEPDGTVYNHPAALRLRGELDADALSRAVAEIVRRHEALRTVFPERGGAPVQVVLPFRGFALRTEALAGVDEAGREAAVRRRVSAEGARRFDLSAGPLFDAVLLRLADDDHVLLLSMHHVVSDGWSLGIFQRELGALYAAFVAGEPSPLPEPEVQYADYAVWQRTRLAGAVLERQLAYWRGRLEGAPGLLELPTDHPRPALQSYRGAQEPVRFSAELLERLEALGRREGATLYMVLLGAFQLLLGRCAGTDDVVVGTPVAGRTRREVEPLIGFFVNTLVMRTDLGGDPSFRELLARVRDVTLGAYDHQDVPFERLVEEMRPERTLSHSPLFQVSFALQNHDRAPASFAGMRAEPVGGDSHTARFDLTLALTTDGGGLRGVVEYGTGLFERATIARMMEQLRQVLEQVAADPGVRLSRLRLVGAEERARLAEWNRTGAPYPAERCVHQLFAEQAARTPNAVAVEYEGRSLTFGELEERANRLAHHLARAGVGPEVRVGLCLERGLEVMTAILGVMKAGGAYVPVDPGHPAERIGYVMDDAAVAMVLTQERLRGRVPARAGVRTLAIDAEWPQVAAEPAHAPATAVTSENLCYVIYTSGSTGRPKGVAMHHRGVVNYLHWGIRHYGADTGSGAPVFSSMAVDLTITNLLPLFAGLPVRMLPEEAPVEALAEALRAKPGFGLIKITPLHLGLLNGLLTPEEARGAARTLVVGADFLMAEPTLFWQDHAPGVRLMNEYGPTETVVGCSAYTLPGGVHRAGPVPVGGPIQNLTFHLLDGHGEPVPVGFPGELYIGGAGVARGYLGRPALSAEKFVPDPFAEPGARMYRTGDRARRLADGGLLIVGRTDHQVKVRGYRVELGEIEAALRRHSAVAECLVMVREDRPGDRRLVAYVVHGGRPADAAELRAHLHATLPEYMVPSAFVLLDALPQTSTGKLDRKTLPAPEYAAGAAPLRPRDALEEQVADAWREVLGVEPGVHDNFFDLGGTSLLLYRVFSRLREVRAELRVVDLFRYPTVEALARHLGAAAGPPAAGHLDESRSRALERRALRGRARGAAAAPGWAAADETDGADEPELELAGD